MKIIVVSDFFAPDNKSQSIITYERINNLLQYYHEHMITEIYQSSYNNNSNYFLAQKHYFKYQKNHTRPSLKDVIKKGFIKDEGDIIISAHPSYITAMTCLIKKLKYQKKWIATINNLDLSIDPFKIKKNLKAKVIDYFSMKIVLKFADSIIFSNIEQKKYVLEKYNKKDNEKYEIIPYAYKYNTKQFTEIASNKSKEINFVYIGSLQENDIRNGKDFFVALDKYITKSNNRKIKMYIVGYVNYLQQEWFKKLKNSKQFIFIFENSSSEIEKYKNLANILISFDANQNLKYYPHLPFKLVNYLAENKKFLIITNNNSPSSKIAQKSKIITSDFEQKNIINAIEKVIKDKNLPTHIENYSPEKTASALNQVIINYKNSI